MKKIRSDYNLGYEYEWDSDDFEIKIAEFDASTGSIPITWCISEDFLKEFGTKKVWVQIATAPMSQTGATAEWRTYAKLSDMMAYVTFLRPGPNRILARITRSKSGVKNWMERRNGKWANDAIKFPYKEIDDDELDEWEYTISYSQWGDQNPHSILGVDMPEEFFASEPFQWEKDWVNFFFKEKSVDQCEFRKRRMLAYSIQPLLFLPVIMVRFLMAFFITIWGYRGINWNPIIHPLMYGTIDVVRKLNGNIFWSEYIANKSILGESNSDIGGPRSPEGFFFAILFLLFPIIMTAIGIAGAIQYLFGDINLKILSAIFMGYIITFLVIGFLTVVTWFFGKLKILQNLLIKIDKWLQEREYRQKELDYKNSLELTCGFKEIHSLKDIPPHRRTVKLRFQQIKGMVCKPFQR